MAAGGPLILQSFEWHTPSSPSSSHYSRLTRLLPAFSSLGVTSLWLPPGCKANGSKSNGYDVFDLWDLGEFEQKGSQGTKWGDRLELDVLMRKARELSIDVVWDAVINHKTGGDRTEETWAVEVDKEDRRYEICPPKKIEAWLRFDFNGRQREDDTLKYSNMQWRAQHFNGTDWDNRQRKHAIYKLIDDPATLTKPFIQPPKQLIARQNPARKSSRRGLTGFFRRFSSDSSDIIPPHIEPARRPGKGWANDVDMEHGNNDFLMFSNIDYAHPEVREDIMDWGDWMVKDIGVDGFRLDAVQHFSFNFTRDWIQHVNAAYHRGTARSRDIFVVGEVWSGDLSRITTWLDAVQHISGRPRVFAFDAPLLYNFSRISEDFRTRSKNLDLRTILRSSLLKSRPEAAVTLATNHDTQPGQTCYVPMLRHLKLLWYAFILLKEEGVPCVFWGDIFGTKGPHAEPAVGIESDDREQAKTLSGSLLVKLMLCRKCFAHGEQKDYWNSASAIGWTRAGANGKDSGCAVVVSVASTSTASQPLIMQIGNKGQIWRDILGHVNEQTTIDSKGMGTFPVTGTGVSVFVRQGSESVLNLAQDLNINVYDG